MKNDPDSDTGNNSILALLQNQRAGVCMSELSEKLQQLSNTVRGTGKKGKLTLEITMNPLQKGGGHAVTVTDKISLKLPQDEPEVSVFYVGDQGQLTRNDPRQRELPLRAVEGGAQPQHQEQRHAVAV